MILSNLYRDTRARVTTTLAALTLAGGIALASPVYSQDIPEGTTPTEFVGPVENYEYQGPKEFRERYGEAAFKDLMSIQSKYQTAIHAEGTALGDSAQAKVLSYIGEENLRSIDAFVNEVKMEAFGFYVQNAPTIEELARDVEAAFNGSTEGLEANIEKYMPVVEGALNLARENATEFYVENQDLVDGFVADVQATFSDSELVAASNEYQQGMQETLVTQFMGFYERNKPLMEQILGDAEATISDPEFRGTLEGYNDKMGRVVLKQVMGEDFAAQVDSVEIIIEQLAEQQGIEIQDLIEELERQRALEKGF
jgi:hypothetical protein